ncbi:MAG: ABC transporter permease subunit [Candidatus Dormibacteraeota bacterium]|nr:ABC transporter permease subunit [Candidatus Dormibacteraeota bacterium]
MTGAGPLRRRGLDGSAVAVYAVVAVFGLLVAGILASALLDSFASTWFGGWLPDGWTGRWYSYAGSEFDLRGILGTTAAVGLLVTALALVVGVPGAYILARRSFPGKRLVVLLLILPMMVPPITYGIPLATMLLEFRLAPSLAGVVIANLVPAMPFVLFVMIPFIERIDPNLERAARTLGAGLGRVFLRVLLPLALPGLLAAGLLVLVRTLALFELTFLTAGAGSQTLVVALYYAVFGAGVRPSQSIDAVAVVYMVTGLVPLLIALRVVNPVDVVARAR